MPPKSKTKTPYKQWWALSPEEQALRDWSKSAPIYYGDDIWYPCPLKELDMDSGRGVYFVNDDNTKIANMVLAHTLEGILFYRMKITNEKIYGRPMNHEISSFDFY